MAIRIQLRRDTAANWVSANPTLRAGEVGIETDTLKFKIGNGTQTWSQITTYANVTPSSLTSSLSDYILAADQGTPGGPAELDSNGDLIIPENSIVLWNKAAYDYITTLTATQPTADRTITFPDATGTVALTSQLPTQYTDELAQDAIATAIAAGTHTNITITYDDSTNKFTFVGANTYSDENAQDAIGNAVGTGLSYNDSTGAISVDTSTIQARVTDVSDTEIGYLNGVTSAIQTQLDDKSTASKTETLTNKTLTTPTINGPTITATGQTPTIHGIYLPAPHNIIFEGTTADDFETTLQAGEPTADRTITLPDATGTVALVANVAALSGATFTGAVSGTDLTLSGNLTVNGTTTTLNSTTISVDDKNIELGSVETPSDATADGGGITLKGTTDKTFNWVDATDAWTSSEHINLASGKSLYLNGTLLKDTAETLTNKTLTSPVISTISNTGTLTLPTTTGTLALTSQIPAATSAATPTAAGIVHGFSSATSNSRTTLGYQAGNSLSGNNNNTVIGYSALSSASTATDNTIIGHRAAQNSTASENVIIGSSSGTSVSSNNTIVGSGSVWGGAVSGWTAIGKGIAGNSASVSGPDNVVVGNFGIYQATSATKNAALGTGVMQSSSTASNNLAAGWNAAQSLTTGSNNTILGYQAGKSGTNNLTTGSNNILIGSNADATSATTSNEIVIGNSSNTVFRIPGLSISATTTALTVPSLTPTNAIAAIYGGTGLTSYATGDILYSSATNTLAKLAAGTNGQILTLASGVPSWAAAPITLPTQTDNSGKYLTTDGTTASWGTLVVPITTGTATITENTATTIDTNALSGFTSIEYMVSLKQGSKVRTSKVIVQTDGTSVDMTEFAITETGGTIAGVVISAAVSSTNAVLQVTATDAATTNVTVKFSEIKL